MKKMLKNDCQPDLYHYVNGERVEGPNQSMTGDCSGLRGDCSGLSGDCSGLRGNLDDCKIRDDERAAGVNIRDLVV